MAELSTSDGWGDEMEASDFGTIDQERDRLFTVARQTILTGEIIEHLLQESQSILSGHVSETDVADFIAVSRHGLTRLMENSNEEDEPSDNDLHAIEQGKAKQSRSTETPVVSEQSASLVVDEDYSERRERERQEAEQWPGVPLSLRRAINAFIEQYPDVASQIDYRFLGALAVGEVDKKKRNKALNIADTLCAFTAHRQGQVDNTSSDENSFIPDDLYERLELTNQERRALEYIYMHDATVGPDREGKVRIEELVIASGDFEHDNEECPPCIRSLHEKLKAIGVDMLIKPKFGKRHRMKEVQGYRVVWVRLQR